MKKKNNLLTSSLAVMFLFTQCVPLSFPSVSFAGEWAMNAGDSSTGYEMAYVEAEAKGPSSPDAQDDSTVASNSDTYYLAPSLSPDSALSAPTENETKPSNEDDDLNMLATASIGGTNGTGSTESSYSPKAFFGNQPATFAVPGGSATPAPGVIDPQMQAKMDAEIRRQARIQYLNGQIQTIMATLMRDADRLQEAGMYLVSAGEAFKGASIATAALVEPSPVPSRLIRLRDISRAIANDNGSVDGLMMGSPVGTGFAYSAAMGVKAFWDAIDVIERAYGNDAVVYTEEQALGYKVYALQALIGPTRSAANDAQRDARGISRRLQRFFTAWDRYSANIAGNIGGFMTPLQKYVRDLDMAIDKVRPFIFF